MRGRTSEDKHSVARRLDYNRLQKLDHRRSTKYHHPKQPVEDSLSVKRTARSAKFKFQVALEAAKETKTLNQLASQYELNPGQVSQWKRQLLDDGPRLFETAPGRDEKAAATREADLYEQIGRLKMELAWLEKKVTR